MRDLNSVDLVGRLTRDAEVSYTNSGTAVTRISLAVNRSVKKDDGWIDEGNFFDVTLFGKMGESLKPYLQKGQQIAVAGELKQDRWEKDGQKFSKVSIIAHDIYLLGSKNNSNNDAPHSNVIAPNHNNYGGVASSEESFKEDIPYANDGDIPF